MIRSHDQDLDPRAWFAWLFAASLPSLLGRNPWPLIIVLMAAVAVRFAWSDRIASESSWTIFLRIALIFSIVSVVFNVLTVRSGDLVILTLPRSIPLIGGDLTLNAVVFGVLSGLALIILVIIGSTVAGLLDWSAVVRLVPDGMTNIAVAGSIAFAFVPQTMISFREIREAQAARGHRVRGARDLLPIVVPMIGGGLERSITLAEALESRSFGAPSGRTTGPNKWRGYLSAIALATGAIAIYLMASGYLVFAAITLIVAAAALFLVVLTGRGVATTRSRYREPHWGMGDTVVAVGSLLAICTILLVLETNPASIRYEPYPRLTMPVVDLRLLIGLLFLFVPVVVVPRLEKPT